ncbi:MAG: M20/M25/M40 family metallo-hydrolase [Deltaproteobacteria bacterium]|jgi:carboxypeptidase PM20D1|nr:M20/M25/M40 family metallo-hydrolase [Deltaproteobacteria bacterium]
MKKLLKIILGLIVIFIAILLVKTAMFTSKQVAVSNIKGIEVDTKAVTQRLSLAFQIKTISHQDPSLFDTSKILDFHKFLENNYPLVHQKLERVIINDYSILFKWQGSDAGLKPVLLNAHMDVVPIEPGTESKWKFPPFSGAIEENFVWGRGAIDMKSTLMAIMEAAEENLKRGLSPKRTIYLSLGHDEELGGENGAKKIAAYLKDKGVQLEFTIDEGMPILDETLSPIKQQTAIIAVAEKGYITLKISTKTKGGHSSMPPLKTTLGILARAIVALEDNQMPASYAGPAKLLFEYLGPEMPFGQKILFANDWIFESVIVGILEKVGVMNAVLRTTTAPTMIEGGVKENVLPSQAHVLVNFRIRPGNTPDDVVTHTKKVINNPVVEVTTHNGRGTFPSPVSSVDAIGFRIMQRTISEIFEDTVISPGLMVAGTDTKHFVSIADNSYRSYPIVFSPKDTGLIHGTNERISVDAYLKMIQYETRLMENISRQ